MRSEAMRSEAMRIRPTRNKPNPSNSGPASTGNRWRIAGTLLLFTLPLLHRSATADEALYRYEGDIHILDPSTGWVIADPCEAPCTESVQDGHFVLSWPVAGDFANYNLEIGRDPETPPRRPCGWSGVSAPTTPWDQSSPGATPCSESTTRRSWRPSKCTVTQRSPSTAAPS